MLNALIAFAVVFALAIVIAAAIKKGHAPNGVWPYKKRKSIQTEPEQILYWRLCKALPDMTVLAQVGLSRVIEVKKGTRNDMRWFWKISQKSVDYVVCRKDATVVAVIELDDASHNGAKQKQSDMDKGKALEDAGVTLIRWHVKNMPSMEEIQNKVQRAMLEQSEQSTSPLMLP